MQANPFDQFDEAPPDRAVGPVVIGTPRPPKPDKPDLPTGWQMGPNGAQPIPGLPASAVSGLSEKPDRPNLPAGYQWSLDGKSAVRVPGLPADPDAEPVKSDADLEAVRAEAIDKIRLAKSLQKRSRDGWFTTGFGSGVMGSMNGTSAYDLSQDTETLKNAGALTRIMEMAKANGGKNPLTPLSNSDFQALSSSLSNLEPGQSDEQYQRNVQRVIDLYTRAYQGAGGTDLDRDLGEVDGGDSGGNGAPGGNPYLASATRRPDGMWDLTWKDGRKQVADSIPLAVGVDDEPPPTPDGGGDDLLRRLHMGVGDVAQGVGDTIGLVANPLNAGINAVLGTNIGTDLGASFRAATGAPDPITNSEKLVTAINRGGAGALAFGGGASAFQGARGITGTIARSVLERPVADVVAGTTGAGSAEVARQNDVGPGGQVAAGVLGALAGGGGASALSKFGNRVPAPPNALLQASDRQSVTLMPADAGGTGTRMMSGAVGKTLGGIPMAEGSQMSLRTARNARDRVAANVGMVADTAGAGQAAQRGARSFIKTSEARGGQLFDQISVAPDADAVTDNTRATLADTIRGFTSNPRLSAIWTGHPRLRQTLEALTPVDVAAEGRREFGAAQEALVAAKGEYETLLNSVSDPRAVASARERVNQAQSALEVAAEKANRPPQGGKVSWEDMKRLRSIVGEIVGNPSLASDGNAQAAMRRFYGALTADMEATATQAGPRALTEFRRANRYWRGRQGRVEDVLASVLGNEFGKGEAAAFEQINRWAQKQGGDFKRLSRTIRSLPREEADTVRASIISRMGEAKPGAQNADGLEFSPAEWTTQWNKLDKRAKAVLFPEAQHRQDLNDLALIFSNMKQAGKYANFSNTALGGNFTATGLTSLAGGLPGVVAAALYSGGTFALGKLLASQQIARKLATVAAAKHPDAFRTRVAQLTTLAGRNPALAGDIKELQATILRVANDNAGGVRSSAANEEQHQNDK